MAGLQRSYCDRAGLLAGQKPLVMAPEEVQRKLFEEQAEKYPCENVITYCNRCTLCIRTVGVNGIHLMELAMGTYGA